MQIPGVNCIAKNPAVLITGSFYCVGKYILVFPFAEPSAFGIRSAAVYCFGIFGEVLREFSRITSSRWRAVVIIIALIILFFQRLLPMGFPVFGYFLFLQFLIKQSFFVGNALLHLFVVGSFFYMSGIHTNLGRINKFKLITFHQDVGKYLFKKVSILKASGVVFPEGRKCGTLSIISKPRNHRQATFTSISLQVCRMLLIP